MCGCMKSMVRMQVYVYVFVSHTCKVHICTCTRPGRLCTSRTRLARQESTRLGIYESRVEKLDLVRPSRCLGDAHPSEMRIGSGRTPNFTILAARTGRRREASLQPGKVAPYHQLELTGPGTSAGSGARLTCSPQHSMTRTM